MAEQTASVSVKLLNNTTIDRITGSDLGLKKEAEDTINAYTRRKIREDGFLRRILPPVTITNDELDRQVNTDKPVKIVDMEPDSPAAISVPLGTSPMNRYIRGQRYRVMFERILTPKFTKDVDELRTYNMDIRQVLSDNSIKDILAEEDGKFVATINSILIGPGVLLTDSGAVQWVQIQGGITRDTMAEAMKVLPRTINHWPAATVLINNVSIYDFVKWGRDEWGGDGAQDNLRTGFTEREMMGGVRFITTIKRDLCPDGTIFMFAVPKALGKHFTLEDTTMYIDRRYFMLEFFAYQYTGVAIGNTTTIGRVDFI